MLRQIDLDSHPAALVVGNEMNAFRRSGRLRASMLKRFAVEICGIATSLLTVALIVLIEQLLDVSVFTWMLWFFVPAGAILCGIVAASGYFVGALLFHRRPGVPLLISMMVVSCATFFLIYAVHYWSMRGQVSFGEYMINDMTSARYSGKEAGAFGVVVALLQLGGFMLGGIILWSKLRGLPACESCQLYFRRRYRLWKRFADASIFDTWQRQLNLAETGGAEFAVLVAQSFRRERLQRGSVDVDCRLMMCENCDAQLFVQKSRMWDGRRAWHPMPTETRDLLLPRGASLRQAFESAKAAES